MAQTKVYQYMLSFKWGTKLIVGLETTGFKGSANFEEMLLKANAGVAVEEFIDVNADLSFSGRTIELDADSEPSTHEDFESLREAWLAGTSVNFVYGRFSAGEAIVTGTCTIREWSEDAGSQRQLGTWSGSAKAARGTVAITTYTPS